MSTITTINASDLITDSRAVINTNFSNLNTDKIETSYLDTDTTLAANSDSKIATQKAVKTYVDTQGGANASTTARGIVEEATQAEQDAGTTAGGTGARLFVNPSTLLTAGFKKYGVGAWENGVVKSYYNVHLLFNLWAGSVDNDTTTTFDNWVRTSDVGVMPGGAMAYTGGTGADSIYLAPFLKAAATAATLEFDDTNIVIMDWWAICPTTSTGDLFIGGFSDDVSGFQAAYNSTARERVCFSQKSTGELYATIAKTGVGVTNTDISSGYTPGVWNNFRIEFDISNNALFYLNGVLKATLSGANLPTANSAIYLGYGRSDTGAFAFTAPYLSLQMNP